MLPDSSAANALSEDTPSAAHIATDLFCFLDKEAILEDLDRTRILARTTDHHVARVPHDTHPGDCVGIFAGAPFPFVLRPAGDNEYEMLGDAHIEGMMKGEVWPEAADDPSLEMFRLI
ncbi:WD repeat-containing protein jip5 [Elasticomyces elasticus]|nr:WD repeat-containing protein jip5 [Elasticomyces elasticus]